MQSQGQTSTHPESLRVTESHPKHTQSHKDADSHNHNCTHLVTYTCSHKVSHTQTDTEQYTVTHREKQTHTVAHRPLETQNNGHIVWAGSSWGGRSSSVDRGGRGGCCTHPLTPAASSKPLPFSRSQILLGPRFAEGEGSQASPFLQPPAMSGG